MSGVTFSRHASDRLAERNIWIENAIKLLEKANRIYPTRKYHTEIIQFWKNGNIIFVLNAKQKKVITCYKAKGSLFL